MDLPIKRFFDAAIAEPSRTAIKDGPLEMTYGELAERVNALAAAFQDMDTAPQSRVGICAYNTREALLAFLAVLAAGKTWVPLNPRNGHEELSRMVAATKPTIIVADSNCRDRFDPGVAVVIRGQPMKPGEDCGGDENLAAMLAAFQGRVPKAHDLGPDDVQALKFTGGSSGRPKGVIQTYRVWHTCVDLMTRSLELDENDRNLMAAPMTHGTGTLLVPTLGAGGMHVFMPQPTRPEGIIEAFEKDRISMAFLPPTVIYMMMAAEDLSKRDFKSLKHIIIGGASMRPAEIKRGLPLFNNALETCFGQTEVPQIATIMRARDWVNNDKRLASCGHATDGIDIRIVDADGNELPPGQAGEMIIRGPLVMGGYLDMPDKTAETIKDGWLHTGDVAEKDDEGFIYIRDRIRDMIVTGGFNVFPTDVEVVLGDHPAVKECVVFGLPDDKWGEAVQAAVEVHKGQSATEEDIIAYVKVRLDSVKAPKRIHFVDELPRSTVGKVLRRECKAMFQEASK
ncbi:MAG: AMP-binding protein [Rhodospirillaceae bacterium]